MAHGTRPGDIVKKLWKNRKTLRENLQQRLPKMAARYFDEGRTAMKTGTTWDDMHQFRLATKRFRYTLELFRSEYGPGLERRLEDLKHVQTFLGDINDCVVTAAMLQNVPETEAVRAKLESVMASKTKKMRRHWASTFDASGAEQSWTRYLSMYACRSVRRPATVTAVPVTNQPYNNALL